ncbi:DUF4158 domain-containing protein [Nonomuraea sp. C10]|uniref:DUF4158 domain-containing protein n=1 Tax=Nonomuraea sp. C10 TaxID=2600577 RepID=UPI0011CD76DC|nr:DUF4158 domain-containing protein [Nonomuraea sp. C10]
MIAESRQDSHRLGVAVQIWTIRYKGLPPAVPWPVVDYLAEQLRSRVKRYGERLDTAYGHAWTGRLRLPAAAAAGRASAAQQAG